jgi:hypothetical protein
MFVCWFRGADENNRQGVKIRDVWSLFYIQILFNIATHFSPRSMQ